MKLSTIQDIGQIEDFESFKRFMSVAYEQLVTILNNGVSFKDNMQVNINDVSFDAANSQIEIKHGLKRIPTGYIATNLSVEMVIYNGDTSNSTSAIYLKSSAIGSARIVIF